MANTGQAALDRVSDLNARAAGGERAAWQTLFAIANDDGSSWDGPARKAAEARFLALRPQFTHVGPEALERVRVFAERAAGGDRASVATLQAIVNDDGSSWDAGARAAAQQALGDLRQTGVSDRPAGGARPPAAGLQLRPMLPWLIGIGLLVVLVLAWPSIKRWIR